MNSDETIREIANGLVHIDGTRVPFRAFQPGVGPYGEPQLVKLLAAYLNKLAKFHGPVRTKRAPDLLTRRMGNGVSRSRVRSVITATKRKTGR